MNQDKQQELTEQAEYAEEQRNEEELINEKAEFLHYKSELESQILHGANWFYWIAGLSVINSIGYLMEYNWSFVCGLGITQIIDALIYEIQGVGRIAGLIVDFALIGGFLLLGRFARKRYNWVFIFGIIIYALDAAIFLLLQDWLSIGFHAYAIYGIYKGWSANRELTSLEANNY